MESERATENNIENPFVNDFGIAEPNTEIMDDVYAFKGRLLEAIEHQKEELDEEDEANEIADLQQMQQQAQSKRKQRLDKRRRIEFEMRSRITQSNLDRFIARRENLPPQWLQGFVDRIESQYTELRAEVRNELRELKMDVNEVKTDLNEVKTDLNEVKTDLNEVKATSRSMDVRLRKVLFSTAISDNVRRRINRQQSEKVPFIVGEGPDDDVPVMQSVDMIDGISKENCEYLLRGYGVSFSRNENVNLKNRLRDVLGFEQVSDLRFTFHPF